MELEGPLEGPPSGGLGTRRKDAPPEPFGPTDAPESVRGGRRTGLRTALVVLLTIVVGLVGIAAYAKYTIRRAEEAEARTELERIAALAIKVHGETGRICPSASGAVPIMMGVPGHYQTRADEWTVDRERNAGFACLGFERAASQYYQYRYEATENGFTATASGQLRENEPERVLRVKGAIVEGKLVVVEPP